MTPFLIAIFFLNLSSLATAAKFTQVFEWNELDLSWSSGARRAQALEDGTFDPEYIKPHYMAVYGTRIFLSLDKYSTIPVTLVSLPTNNASSTSPKLTPVPSWDMHGRGDCNKIEEATGLEVDSVGRLWVLDQGSDDCNAKLWTIDLNKNDQTKLIHRFSFQKLTHDLALDETPDGTFAYISRWYQEQIVVFNLERNQSWIVKTPDVKVFSLALSPKDQEPSQLYLSNHRSNELYSISVATLRNRTRSAKPKLIGKWTERTKPFRMLMDNGNMYVAFRWENYISAWNSSQPFQEQRFHKVVDLNPYFWPFTFSLDQSGTLWMTVFYYNEEPRCRLLKAAAGEKYLPDDASGAEAQSRMLIGSSVFFVFLLAMAIS
ncbi:protein yellow-like [Cloeon dipterum]|uniref:protein yellow-like n=1 Tax=Cloeon dipterum TaxID=197152 RepID=UPI0032205F08